MFSTKIWTTPLWAERYYYFKRRISTPMASAVQPMASAVQLTRRIAQTILLGNENFLSFLEVPSYRRRIYTHLAVVI